MPLEINHVCDLCEKKQPVNWDIEATYVAIIDQTWNVSLGEWMNIPKTRTKFLLCTDCGTKLRNLIKCWKEK